MRNVPLLFHSIPLTSSAHPHRSRFWGAILLSLLFIIALSACGSDDDDGLQGDSDWESIGDGDSDSIEAEAEAAIEPTSFWVGYGERDITPPDGTVMGAFGAPGGARVTEGVHDPLMVQVAFFTNDAKQAMFIISIDSAGYSYEFGDWGPGVKVLRERIAEAVADDIKIDPHNIMLGSSHSHSSTDLVGFWQPVGEGVPLDILNDVLEKTVAASVDAVNNQQPAELFYAHTELVGHSGRDADCSPVIDNSVNILQPRTLDGEPIVTITNYAKHPTALGSGNKLASADWIWGYREEMKLRTGVSGMFLQGEIAAVHSGPLSGTVPGDDAWERAYNIGSILADSVMEALGEAEVSDEYDIRHRWANFSCETVDSIMKDVYTMLDMPKRNITLTADNRYIVEEMETSWHKLGIAEFGCLPGEGSPEYSIFLRERMISPYKFTVGLCNDEIGYIVEPESLANDTSGQLEGYESKMGVGMKSGPAMWEALESLNCFNGAWQDTVFTPNP